MSFRKKILVYTGAFFLIVTMLGLGAFYVIARMSDRIENSYENIVLDLDQDMLMNSIEGIGRAYHAWVQTHEDRYVEKYHRHREMILQYRKQHPEQAETDLHKRIDDFSASVEEAFAGGGQESEYALQQFEKRLTENAIDLLDEVAQAHLDTMQENLSTVQKARHFKARMLSWLLALVGASLVFSALLIRLLRRTLETPYLNLLDATERVTSGDLSHRMLVTRSDEFGVIAQRFNRMVESLEVFTAGVQRRLQEKEMVLEVYRTAEGAQSLDEALSRIVTVISRIMEKPVSAIFLHELDSDNLRMRACSVGMKDGRLSIPLSSELVTEVMTAKKTVVMAEFNRHIDMSARCLEVNDVLMAPVITDGTCTGLLMIGCTEHDTCREEDIHLATILSHSIGSVIRNIELDLETRDHLTQLETLFSLSKALTSVYRVEELLETITQETRKLLRSKACEIRLVEAGQLVVKSWSALDGETSHSVASVAIGDGIPGRIARDGKPLLVERVEQLPPDWAYPDMVVQTLIAVPLKKDETIIGVLSVFDRIDELKGVVAFSPNDLALVEGLASISALAIDKARMLEREKQVDLQMLMSEKRMDLLYESIQSGIVTLDRNFVIKTANKYIERWSNRPLKEILLESALDVFHDKTGICPHCAARATFEEGGINSITQSTGLNYAELNSYPVLDENGVITEAIVVIHDITDRVLYQEEIMGLYREVLQTKEYNESLINNSADAIITMGVDGTVRTWNPAAETIYGYTAAEAAGKVYPIVPADMMDAERDNRESLKRGEVLKLETRRQCRDGRMIDVSLTLSPIKDLSGEVIGFSDISHDITNRKIVQQELLRRNQELSRLFFISAAMRGTLELQRLVRMVLSAVTMGEGLGFNRAILFLVDERAAVVRAVMGVGPSSHEEAWRVWGEIGSAHKSLNEVMKEIDSGELKGTSFLDSIPGGIELPLDDESPVARAIRERKPINVTVQSPGAVDRIILERTGSLAYAAVPLISQSKVIGVLWVDNHFNHMPITEDDLKFLRGFADQVASGIESARMFEQVSRAEAELENIFSSISDMVFLTAPDYTIQNINQAVVHRIGKPREEIVGRKCYEIFHGKDKPWESCPHSRTLVDHTSHMEEVMDPHLDGTFLTSTAPMFSIGGELTGTVHVVRDITEMKELRERLQHSERMAALGEVAARVAHEIRNPLVSVGGFAKRLEERLKGPHQKYAEIISTEVRRLESILRDILSFAREARMFRQLVDFNHVVQSVMTLLDGEFAGAGNRVETFYEPHGAVMYIDPDRVREAILNIIVNANQATANGVITVSTKLQGAHCVFEVEDTGVGISDEDIDKVFNPFYTTRTTGTGLGLAVARRIIEENKGSIEIIRKTQGTLFRILLPIMSEDAHPSEDEKNDKEGGVQ